MDNAAQRAIVQVYTIQQYVKTRCTQVRAQLSSILPISNHGYLHVLGEPHYLHHDVHFGEQRN